MKKLYIFCHGFGFSNLFWKNLAPYFTSENCIYLNLGYLGKPNLDINLNLSEYMLIGIGHSLGFIKLLKLNLPFKYLIGLNGFINFLGNDPSIHKKRYLELKALRYNLLKNPKTTIQAFYTRCELSNWEYNFNSLNLETLINDLTLLESSFNLPKNLPTFIIFTKNDTIVPWYIVNDNFNNNYNVSKSLLNNGSHALGFNNPETIKILIDNYLNAKIYLQN